MNNRKYICWITSSFLLDVDIPIVPALQADFDIDWIVLTTQANYAGDKILIKNTGCKSYNLVIDGGIFINPKKFFFYKRLIGELKSKDYDIYYFDTLGMPYLMPLVQTMLPKEKVIIAAHNVKTPKGARYYWMAKPYMKYVVRSFINFQVFSKNQLQLLQSLKKEANILYAPLCLKDYGNPSIQKPTNPTTFLFFGNIVEYKRVDLLLKATRILKDRGITNFKVQISGYCRPEQWANKYANLMDGLDNVSLDNRRIPNDIIPNLFESCHYFVMPYQDIAQSGAMTVALCYNLPIIASELDTFKEFMDGKSDGYFFEVGSAEELAEVMKKALENHTEKYLQMRMEQAKKVEEKLSTPAILDMYKTYIEQLCHN